MGWNPGHRVTCACYSVLAVVVGAFFLFAAYHLLPFEGHADSIYDYDAQWSPRQEPLLPLFEALSAIEHNPVESAVYPIVVRILQLGDSHTAGDQFTGHLRTLFQRRFGAAGRGALPPGVPFLGFRPHQVTVTQRGNWRVVNSKASDSTGIFGLSGFRLESRRKGDSMTLTANAGERGFDQASLSFVQQPKGGAIIISTDKGKWKYRLKTSGRTTKARIKRLKIPVGSRRLHLQSTGGGVVSILSWMVETNKAGVVFDSYGIVGATAHVMKKWSPETVTLELAQRQPDLLLVAYGTNDGFDDNLVGSTYLNKFRKYMRFLRDRLPFTAIVVIGPPDAERLPRSCRRLNSDQVDLRCRPLTKNETKKYKTLFFQPGSRRACRWHPPPKLETVRMAQQTVSRKDGYYFWNWSRVMGGKCGTDAWHRKRPALAAGDRVHFKKKGYIISAEALFKELMGKYAAYQRR